MTGVKGKYQHEGREVEGESVPFTTGPGEQWNLYTLEDGSQMKMKLILMDVIRLDAYSPTGDPVYQFVAQQVVNIIPNPALKKKVG